MTDAEIKEHLDDKYYYREDGRLCWKTTTPFRKAGQVAGWKSNTHKYRTVKVAENPRKNLPEHRAIFLMKFGWLPEIVDHINNDKLDNRIENLRESDCEKNAFNRSKQHNNTSGYPGVTFIKRDDVWRANIGYKGQKIFLGQYKAREDAVRARQEAELRYYGELRCRKNAEES